MQVVDVPVQVPIVHRLQDLARACHPRQRYIPKMKVARSIVANFAPRLPSSRNRFVPKPFKVQIPLQKTPRTRVQKLSDFTIHAFDRGNPLVRPVQASVTTSTRGSPDGFDGRNVPWNTITDRSCYLLIEVFLTV